MILLIDFEKAFDTLVWSFIQKSLSLSLCLTQTLKNGLKFFIKISNPVLYSTALYQLFPIERGCRQCDPLSRYMFIISAEILAVLIRKHKDIKGIKINNTEFLISQYADGTSLFWMARKNL